MHVVIALGKGEVECSNHSGSTIIFNDFVCSALA